MNHHENKIIVSENIKDYVFKNCQQEKFMWPVDTISALTQQCRHEASIQKEMKNKNENKSRVGTFVKFGGKSAP